MDRFNDGGKWVNSLKEQLKYKHDDKFNDSDKWVNLLLAIDKLLQFNGISGSSVKPRLLRSSILFRLLPIIHLAIISLAFSIGDDKNEIS